MSSLTTNLKLVKPELQDNITPTIFADNFDKIDAALEGVSGGALSLEEIEASTNLDGKIPSAAALKEVNNSFQWKLIGSVTGKTPITLPSNFSEILVIVKANNENYNFNIPKMYLDETNKMFSHGKGLHISETTYLVQIRISISTNKVVLNDARGSENTSIKDYSSKTVTTAYYR